MAGPAGRHRGGLGSFALQGLVEPEGIVAVSGAAFPQYAALRGQGGHQLPVLADEGGENVADQRVPALAGMVHGERGVEWQGKELLRHTRRNYYRKLLK